MLKEYERTYVNSKRSTLVSSSISDFYIGPSKYKTEIEEHLQQQSNGEFLSQLKQLLKEFAWPFVSSVRNSLTIYEVAQQLKHLNRTYKRIETHLENESTAKRNNLHGGTNNWHGLW